MTPAGTSNELDVRNGWEENTHTLLLYYINTTTTADGPQGARLKIPYSFTACNVAILPSNGHYKPAASSHFSCIWLALAYDFYIAMQRRQISYHTFSPTYIQYSIFNNNITEELLLRPSYYTFSPINIQ